MTRTNLWKKILHTFLAFSCMDFHSYFQTAPELKVNLLILRARVLVSILSLPRLLSCYSTYLKQLNQLEYIHLSLVLKH